MASRTRQVQNQFARLIGEFGPNCHYCGVLTTRDVEKGDTIATRDHIVPRIYGGLCVIENLVLACGRCNSTRGHEVNYCDCERCVTVTKEFFDQRGWSVL